MMRKICIVYSGKSALELCFETPKQHVKPTECFIVQRLLRWFHHTDRKHCAFCLTCGDKALGRRANDLTKIAGNFEKTSITSLLRIDLNIHKTRQQTIQINMSNAERTQGNYKNLRITKKKNSHICTAINIFQLHCR